jgi:hypothetical protein
MSMDINFKRVLVLTLILIMGSGALAVTAKNYFEAVKISDVDVSKLDFELTEKSLTATNEQFVFTATGTTLDKTTDAKGDWIGEVKAVPLELTASIWKERYYICRESGEVGHIYEYDEKGLVTKDTIVSNKDFCNNKIQEQLTNILNYKTEQEKRRLEEIKNESKDYTNYDNDLITALTGKIIK